MSGTVLVWDPSGVWVPVAGRGPTGYVGFTGPTGPTGPPGPHVTSPDEVAIGPTPPTNAESKVWFDTTHPGIAHIGWPPGGTAGQAVVKASTAEADMTWAGPHFPTAGGTMSGNLNAPRVTTTVAVTPTVNGDARFSNHISANQVTDRSGYPAWEMWDIVPNLTFGWYPHTSHGPTYAYCNKYSVVICMSLYRAADWPENVWLDLLMNPLPIKYRPAIGLFDVKQMSEDWELGSVFEQSITFDGQLRVRMIGGTPDWNSSTNVAVFFSYPRAFG